MVRKSEQVNNRGRKKENGKVKNEEEEMKRKIQCPKKHNTKKTQNVFKNISKMDTEKTLRGHKEKSNKERIITQISM